MSPLPWRFTFLGYRLSLAQPEALAFLPLVVVVAVVALWRLPRGRDFLERTISPRLLGRLLPSGSARRDLVRVGSVGAALVLLVLGLAQPQCGERTERIRTRGIDVVVALDASKSMRARDVPPDRLERAKLELAALLDELRGDRVGIVAFAGQAFVQCPLTTDYSAAKSFLKAIDPESMPEGGTDIADALRVSAQVLEGAGRTSQDKVIVLISDGEDLEGGLDEAIKGVARGGIKVFAVGIGSEQGEPIPVVDKSGQVRGYQKDAEGRTIFTRLDRASLSRLAEETGGAFFYQPRGVAMSQVVERISKLQKSELEGHLTTRYEERFQAFAAVGLGLFLLGSALPRTRRRK